MKLLLLLLIPFSLVMSAELIPYEVNAAKDKAVNLVIVAEGYTATERAKFESDIAIFAGAIFSDPMLAQYRSYHNVYGVFVASNESGADDPLGGVSRDTYFDATYNGYNIDRLLICNSSLVQTEVDKVIPEADAIIVAVNYKKYGGSGGAIATSSTGAPEIAAHEIGHSFVGLKDEYDYTANYTPYEGINATAKTSWSAIRWNYWIEQSTPLPTPETGQYSSVVGLFEGANYQASGWYRPQLNCRMKSNGVNLCAVCSEAWLLQIYDLVSPIKSLSHSAGSSFEISAQIPLIVDHHQSTSNSVVVEWYMDGQKLSESGNQLISLPEDGLHTVKVIVRDKTSLIRNDPSGLLVDSVSWQVTYGGNTGSSDVADFKEHSFILKNRVLHLNDSFKNRATVSLYTISGKRVWKSTVYEKSVRLSSNLSSSSYVIHIDDEIRSVQRQVFIK